MISLSLRPLILIIGPHPMSPDFIQKLPKYEYKYSKASQSLSGSHSQLRTRAPASDVGSQPYGN